MTGEGGLAAPDKNVFSVAGVDGGLMLVRNRGSWKAFFDGDGRGRPVEFTSDQLRDLRDVLDQALGDS